MRLNTNHMPDKDRRRALDRNRAANKMGTYFEMGTNGYCFVCFQIGIS